MHIKKELLNRRHLYISVMNYGSLGNWVWQKLWMWWIAGTSWWWGQLESTSWIPMLSNERKYENILELNWDWDKQINFEKVWVQFNRKSFSKITRKSIRSSRCIFYLFMSVHNPFLKDGTICFMLKLSKQKITRIWWFLHNNNIHTSDTVDTMSAGGWVKQRYVLCLLMFTGLITNYMLRINISIAIVKMAGSSNSTR